MVCPPATSEAGIMSAKVVSCSNINGYLRNYQDCLTLVQVEFCKVLLRVSNLLDNTLLLDNAVLELVCYFKKKYINF
jgi:hypothetical protein